MQGIHYFDDNDALSAHSPLFNSQEVSCLALSCWPFLLLRKDLRGQVRQAITGAGSNDPLSQVSDREIKSP